MKRKLPMMKKDADAEKLLDHDLSNLDFRQFKPVNFEFAPKAARINMRLPEPLLQAIKSRAANMGIPYQRLIRLTLEHALSSKK